MAESNPISKVIGANLRAWREAAKLEQNAVAFQARGLGLDWTSATVGAIETGRREVSLDEFVVLPFIVARFDYVGGGRWRRLGGFIGIEPQIVTVSNASIRGEDLYNLVSGWAVGGEGRVVPGDALHPPARQPREIKARREAAEAAFDAEMKAARRLGVPQIDIVGAAHRLWGRTLTAERDARVAHDAGSNVDRRTLQALRGHVTRTLVAELRQTLKPERRKRKTGR